MKNDFSFVLSELGFLRLAHCIALRLRISRNGYFVTSHKQGGNHMCNILVTTPTFSKFSPEPANRLLAAGNSITRIDPAKGPITENVIIKAIDPEATEVIICGLEPITARVMDAAPKLKMIVKHGIGVDNVQLPEAKARGIGVYNAPGSNSDAVADMAMALLFAIARDVVVANKTVEDGDWPKKFTAPVWGKTLGIIGFGNIGRGMALRGLGMHMRVLAYDPYFNEEFANAHGIEKTDVQTILKESDFVSIHMPLTEETRNSIGLKELSSMKATAFLINTARGGIINEDDLYTALKERRIAGAAFDAFASEPPTCKELIGLPNMISTPHMGGYTQEAVNNASIMVAETVVDLLQGKTRKNRIV